MQCAAVAFGMLLALFVLVVVHTPPHGIEPESLQDPPELPPHTVYIGFSCTQEFRRKWRSTYALAAFALSFALNRTAPHSVMLVEEECARPCDAGRGMWPPDTLVYHSSCMFPGQPVLDVPAQQLNSFEPMVRSVLYPLHAEPAVLVFVTDDPSTVERYLLVYAEEKCPQCFTLLLLFGPAISANMDGLRSTATVTAVEPVDDDELAESIGVEMGLYLERLLAHHVLRIERELDTRAHET